MTERVYEWGRRSYAVPAPVVAETVEGIATREGCCPPARLVAEAESEVSPLHRLFTWDDNAAAGHWRTHEARQIIGAITVRVIVGDTESRGPAFASVGHTSVTMDRGEGYRSIGVVMRDKAWKEEALAEALSRLDACRARYETLEELAPVWAAMESIRPRRTKRPKKAA